MRFPPVKAPLRITARAAIATNPLRRTDIVARSTESHVSGTVERTTKTNQTSLLENRENDWTAGRTYGATAIGPEDAGSRNLAGGAEPKKKNKR